MFWIASFDQILRMKIIVLSAMNRAELIIAFILSVAMRKKAVVEHQQGGI